MQRVEEEQIKRGYEALTETRRERDELAKRAAAAEELAEQRALFAHEQAARMGALAKMLNRIAANAESWHGGDAAKGRALNVIAGWAREALGAQRQEHTQDCQDFAFIHHASTGGDADCICGAQRQEGDT
jgi:hypothetical protein